MSSATSINRAGRARRAEAETPSTGSSRAESFRPVHFFVLLSLIGATVAVVIARQPTPAHLVLLSVMIGTAGACAAALYATIVPLVRSHQTAERVTLSNRARAGLEREKMLVLRSIKELEFDRAMGKISAADFDEMAGRLRIRALALMKQLESPDSTHRAAIEQEPQQVAKTAVAAPVCTCGTKNDADASFCKKCGQRLRPEH